MTTKEVATLCGVTSRTVSGNARKAGIILEDGKIHNWTEDEVRKLQLVLMNNMQNRGNAATLGNVVENTARDALQGGMTLMEIIHSGNIEAMKELMDLSMTAVQETARNKQLEAEKKALLEQNTQLIEQKNAAEAETERIKQYNRNFHNSLYTATEVANMLGVTPNRIGREAKNHNLKLEPLYGMLGKIKLSNGKLVSQFCYNDDAIRILKAIICADK